VKGRQTNPSKPGGVELQETQTMKAEGYSGALINGSPRGLKNFPTKIK